MTNRLVTRRLQALAILACVLATTGAVGITAPHVYAQDVTLARITLPVRGQTVRGNISIQGTATSPQFIRYEVAYALEPDLANWTVLNGALQAVTDGVLAVWNTRPLADGTYALRLQVFNSDGTVNETFVRDLTLANAGTAATEDVPATTTITDTTTDESDAAFSLDLSELPGAFLRGARYALYAFGALGVYVLVKKLIGLALRRMMNNHIDYGR
ncbi:MAG: hypothetical protein M1546_17350 [Chloroflexi bacterium]|nr:hypothetical protein [Chloroflexota bacterium]